MAERDGPPGERMGDAHRQLPTAQLGDSAVTSAAVAAHRGVGEHQHCPRFAAGQRLQHPGAGHWEAGRLSGDIDGFTCIGRRRGRTEQPFLAQHIDHQREVPGIVSIRLTVCAPHRSCSATSSRHALAIAQPAVAVSREAVRQQPAAAQARRPVCRRDRRRLRVRQREVEQPPGIVARQPQHLTAGDIAIHRRNAPVHYHLAPRNRQAIAHTRQRGAVSAQQERRLQRVAFRLLERQRRQFLIADATLRHHPRQRQRQVPADLPQSQRVHAARLVRRQSFRMLNRAQPAPNRCISHRSDLIQRARCSCSAKGR